MEKLHVGQVVFILLREEHRIAPVQVVEEVVRRKLGGEEVNYFVRANSNPKSKVLPLELKKERVFFNIEDARSFMIDNATKAIEGICEDAMKIAASFDDAAGASPLAEEAREVYTPPPSTPPGHKRVRLPTGEYVNVKID